MQDMSLRARGRHNVVWVPQANYAVSVSKRRRYGCTSSVRRSSITMRYQADATYLTGNSAGHPFLGRGGCFYSR